MCAAAGGGRGMYGGGSCRWFAADKGQPTHHAALAGSILGWQIGAPVLVSVLCLQQLAVRQHLRGEGTRRTHVVTRLSPGPPVGVGPTLLVGHQ